MALADALEACIPTGCPDTVSVPPSLLRDAVAVLRAEPAAPAGISLAEHEAVVAERDAAIRQRDALQDELDAIKRVVV